MNDTATGTANDAAAQETAHETAHETARRWWAERAFATGPVDRVAAAQAVRGLYRVAGCEEPEIRWCASPAEAARLVAEEQAGFGPSLRERIRTEPWREARAALLARLGHREFAVATREACEEFAPTVSQLIQQVNGAVAASGETEPERTRLLLALTFADHGQHDAAWLPLFDACPPRPGRAHDLLRALAEVAGQTHWWWPFANVAVLCERPVRLHLDEQGRLHHGDGPALAYPDGFALYRWRGVTIPEDFARTLAALTPEIIREERNAELRRIMLEHYGHDRYIVDSGAEPVQEDEAGRLWRVRLPDDEPIAMVEVVNASAEPDGSHRTYWLRVPPGLNTAKDAVAWTFGLSGEEYRPQVQT